MTESLSEYVKRLWRCRRSYKDAEARLDRQIERLSLNMTCDTYTLAERLMEAVVQKRRLHFAVTAFKEMKDLLTGEESAVFSAICDGFASAEVAQERGRTLTHIRRIYRSAHDKCKAVAKRLLALNRS